MGGLLDQIRNAGDNRSSASAGLHGFDTCAWPTAMSGAHLNDTYLTAEGAGSSRRPSPRSGSAPTRPSRARSRSHTRRSTSGPGHGATSTTSSRRASGRTARSSSPHTRRARARSPQGTRRVLRPGRRLRQIAGTPICSARHSRATPPRRRCRRFTDACSCATSSGARGAAYAAAHTCSGSESAPSPGASVGRPVRPAGLSILAA